ncbi:hypothetical protein AC579_9443 [Pseudocercospora musae]|uniref:Uncharacterized protein n=1 Tax=Pseudocercospora musae TaxID=113226 RepID=A0A139HI11_9PEZI|nr:hypothetical protein AC579_9443 [Pseudocercospora musae]
MGLRQTETSMIAELPGLPNCLSHLGIRLSLHGRFHGDNAEADRPSSPPPEDHDITDADIDPKRLAEDWSEQTIPQSQSMVAELIAYLEHRTAHADWSVMRLLVIVENMRQKHNGRLVTRSNAHSPFP